MKNTLLNRWVILFLAAAAMQWAAPRPGWAMSAETFAALLHTGFDGETPVGIGDKFSRTEPVIRCLWRSTMGNPGAEVLVRWIAVQAEGAPPDYPISETTVTLTEGDWWEGHSYIKRDEKREWPVGRYRVDIYMDKIIIDQIYFTVE